MQTMGNCSNLVATKGITSTFSVQHYIRLCKRFHQVTASNQFPTGQRMHSQPTVARQLSNSLQACATQAVELRGGYQDEINKDYFKLIIMQNYFDRLVIGELHCSYQRWTVTVTFP